MRLQVQRAAYLRTVRRRGRAYLMTSAATKGYEAFGSFHSPSIDALFASSAPLFAPPAIVSNVSMPSTQLLLDPASSSDCNRQHFHLDLKQWTFLNHGAFGATTTYAMQVAIAWRMAAEQQPLWFYDRALFPYLVQSIKSLASLIHVQNPNEVVLLPNATSGLHAVLASVVDAAPTTTDDPVIVCFSTRYGAVRKMLQSMENSSRLVVQEQPLSLHESYDDAQVLARLRTALERLDSRCVLVVVDHVTSNSGVVLPVKEIVEICHAVGIPVLVDGAHALLNLKLDVNVIGADYYVGNCHKWFASSKGAAFLHVNSRSTVNIVPRVVSHGFFDGFQSAFMWTGLQDYSAWLSIPQCIDYWQHQGGFEACRNYMHTLVQEAAELLLTRWNLTEESQTMQQLPTHKRHAMRLVRLPTTVFGLLNGSNASNTSAEAKFVQDRLHHEHRIEVPVKCVDGVLYVRISAHVYNCIADYERLAEAIQS